ncbi:unnamed protein product [Effrenium voratum]|nr:unnamed protein product [Effrenium voratum]
MRPASEAQAPEMATAVAQVPLPNFVDAAQVAFWLPLLSDQLMRSGYTPYATGAAPNGRRTRRARKLGPSGRRGADLLQACWDHHSKGGCNRMACKWHHCELDQWQSSWLRLQRFCFGAQLATFDSFDDLCLAVRHAFSDEARMAGNAPANVFAALQAALKNLSALGYPFEVAGREVPGSGNTGSARHQGGHENLLESVRELATAAMPGCQVLPVGSFAWGVDVEGSDLDVVLTSPPGAQEGDLLEQIGATLRRLQQEKRAPSGLEAAEFAIYGPGAMPVLALRLMQEGELFNVDICPIGNLSSVRDVLLFRHMFVLMPRLPSVLQLLKRWLRLRNMPTSSEGGYPQIFWMRLAARTFQTVGCEVPEGEEGDEDLQVRQQLRGFCAQWSQSLPTWGDLMNLIGEEPSPYLKRLPAGVYGATALHCLQELTVLSSTLHPEELQPVPPQHQLCPAKARFWAAFLIPGDFGDAAVLSACTRRFAEDASGDSAASQARLVAGWVKACVGPKEAIRCGYTSKEPGPGSALSTSGPEMCRHEFISRRDAEWAMLVDISWQDPDLLCGGRVCVGLFAFSFCPLPALELCSALQGGSLAAMYAADALPSFGAEKEEPTAMDHMEERLKQELRNTSFAEWKAAGFDPQAKASSETARR